MSNHDPNYSNIKLIVEWWDSNPFPNPQYDCHWDWDNLAPLCSMEASVLAMSSPSPNNPQIHFTLLDNGYVAP